MYCLNYRGQCRFLLEFSPWGKSCFWFRRFLVSSAWVSAASWDPDLLLCLLLFSVLFVGAGLSTPPVWLWRGLLRPAARLVITSIRVLEPQGVLGGHGSVSHNLSLFFLPS